MAQTKIGLYELLTPQFLAGFTFPAHVDEYLSILLVDELYTAVDDSAVVYTGSVILNPEVIPKRQHKDAATGVTFSWDDEILRFRLTLPRRGSPDLANVFNQLNAIGTGGAPVATALGVVWAGGGNMVQQDLDTMQNMWALLNNELGAVVPPPAAPPLPTLPQIQAATTDYPDIEFRLELMINSLTFQLGETWKPATFANHRIVLDSTHASERVKFVLPQVVLEYRQGPLVAVPPVFTLNSWGSGGFNAVADTAAGELVRMEPPLAIHENGRVGFGIDRVILDLSQTSTPPEILKHYGTDNNWTGLYVKSVRFFYTAESQKFAFGIGVNDALISFAGEVSLEAYADVFGNQVNFEFETLLFDGNQKIDYYPGKHGKTLATTDEGSAVFPDYGTIQVRVTGGVPPFTINVQQDGAEIWNPNANPLQTKLQAPQKDVELTVHVTDAKGNELYQKTLLVLPTRPQKQLPPGKPIPAPAVWHKTSPDVLGYEVLHVPAPSGTTETLNLAALSNEANITINSQPPKQFKTTDKALKIDVGENVNLQVKIEYQAEPQREEFFDLWFKYERPRDGEEAAVTPLYVSNFPSGAAIPEGQKDERFMASTLPRTTRDPNDPTVPHPAGAAALHEWLDTRVPTVGGVKTVHVFGYASYESDPNKAAYNLKLSERRLNVTKAILADYAAQHPGVTVNVNPQDPRGQTFAQQNKALHGDVSSHADYPVMYPPAKNDAPGAPQRHGDKDDRVVTISAQLAAPQNVTLTGTLSRGANIQPLPPKQQKQNQLPPAPLPPANQPPPIFRRMSGRFKLERNNFALAELSGELDFETEMEKGLRNGVQGTPQSGQLPSNQKVLDAGEDGVLDFLVNVTYDNASKYITETLALHSGQGDQNGLIKYDAGNTGSNTGMNILGAMLTFMPIIGQTVPNTNTANAADWALMGVAWAFPAALGALSFLQTKSLTLYGGELRSRQYAPATPNVQFTDAGVIFDYGVEFEVHVDALKIHSTKPLRVRYKACGFNLHFGLPGENFQYQPIFDPSKGYEIDLSDPGLFNISGVLGDLFRIMGVRLARFNPLTLELDLGIKANLGVITVDTFKIKWPLYPNVEVPMILPSGVHIDISNTVIGSGHVNVTETGFQGSIDITLVPLKIRIAASLAVEKVSDDSGRTETGVYFGLTVEFPTPIVLGATGLGIFGFSGLFAMHYRRTEDPRKPDDSIGPALRWLEKAGGEPARLFNNNNSPLWEPQLDRWSFGLGMILGTVEGGVLINLRGMFLLELPGPRILIFVKMKLISALPKLGDKELTVGLLGVLDLDFGQQQVTLGVIIDFEIEDLLQVRLPIELFFSWKDTRNWHLDIGTIAAPASMNLLGIVKGTGYFMLHGDEIKNFPVGEDAVTTLPGTAVAAGVYAPMIWGSEDAGLYAKVYLKADVGVSFEPFFLVGNLRIGGELNLWVISIEAHASLLLKAPPLYFKGELCGKVDLVLFSAEGCVDVSYGKEKSLGAVAPDLITNCWLQSFAPVIAAGQAGDRPIDASLGNAVVKVDDEKIPVVSIDSIPVLQLLAPPKILAATKTYTSPLKTAPGFKDVEGWCEAGAELRSRYELKSVELFEQDTNSPADFGGEIPPAVWRKEINPDNKGVDTKIDLALGSRTPVTAARALERSTELSNWVIEQWKGVCVPPAPPACVLWTLCGEKLGKSGHGWTLDGIALPDPPDTQRDIPPPTELYIEEPTLSVLGAQANLFAEKYGDVYWLPADVIGVPSPGGAGREQSRTRCQRALRLPREWKQNYQGAAVAKSAAYLAEQAKLKLSAWLRLHTGAASQVRLWLAVESNTLTAGTCFIRQLDAQGKQLNQTPLLSVPHKIITQLADFPTNWTSAKLPWNQEVQPVYSFLTGSQYSSLTKILLDIRPVDKCVTIEIYVAPELLNRELGVLVAAVEVCSLAEQGRYEYESSVQKGKQETIHDYLDEGDLVPLLKPGKTYHLKVAYDAWTQVKDKNDEGKFNGQSVTDGPKPAAQDFYFKTDDKAPNRLDPWVLGTTPTFGDQFHFYKDKLKVVFNDQSAIQLFTAYNGKLQFSVRGANGAPVLPEDPNQPGVNLDSGVNVDLDAHVDSKPSDVSSPYYDTLVESLEKMPCVNGSGLTLELHFAEINANLVPLMGYTFDIDLAKIDDNLPLNIKQFKDKNNNPMKGTIPFFRRAFKTSRYSGVAEFAAAVSGAKITHRKLQAVIDKTGDGEISDNQLTQKLLDAGEQTLPAPRENRVVIYWTPNDKPQAILIDTVEPAWRTREEAELQPVPGSDDPNFKRVEYVRKPSLLVEEIAPGKRVEKYVYANGGARTLVFLKPNAPPNAQVKLQLRQPASQLFELAEKSAPLCTVILTAKAPWQED